MATIRKVLRHLKEGTGTVLRDTFKANHEVIRTEEDLPGEPGETHVLEDDVEYEFNGTVQIDGSIQLASSNQLKGSNWAKDVIYYTGTGSLFTGVDSEFFMRNLSVMAPSGTVFNIEADNTTEFLTQDCAVLAANNLGTIDGYRIPSFKDFAFGSFNEGLTFLGNPDKIFVISCPFRDAADGSSALKLDGNGGLSVNLIHIEASFAKDFGAGANFLEVAGDPVNDFGVVATVTSDFDLKGALSGVSKSDPKWQFVGNSDVPDSSVSGVADQTGNHTVTVTTGDGDAGNPKRATGASTGGDLERFSHSNTELTYTGVKDRKVNCWCNATMQSTGGAEVDVSIYVGINGSAEPVGNQTVTLGSGGESRSARAEAYFDVTQGDSLQVFIENNTSEDDIQINDLDLFVGGA